MIIFDMGILHRNGPSHVEVFESTPPTTRFILNTHLTKKLEHFLHMYIYMYMYTTFTSLLYTLPPPIVPEKLFK